MRLANLMRRRNYRFVLQTRLLLFFLLLTGAAIAQENSPYSRYGLGTALPPSNVLNRGMGGVAVADTGGLSINYSNPASYAKFPIVREPRSGKALYGRVLFDVGINFENKTLHEPSNPAKFSSPYGSFSHVQLGIPLRKGWGLSFGLRQLNRISYKVGQHGPIFDADTHALIDTGYTEYTGTGGTFLPNIGTGVSIKNLSLGVTVGYLFGRRDYSTTRVIYDTAAYKTATYDADASYGDVFVSGGAQYKAKLNRTGTTVVNLGVSGNLKQTLSASRDLSRLATSATTGTTDTVYQQQSIKGTIIYPASYTAGFILEHQLGNNGGFLFGSDFSKTKWDAFRFFNAPDSVQDNWLLHVGAQLRPNAKAGSGYFSNVSYRAGFYTGSDYIHVGQKLPVYGVTFGMGLPLANYNRLSPGQFTIINVALEYEQRGNNKNILKENLFRLSIGLNFSDLWFSKRKYE